MAKDARRVWLTGVVNILAAPVEAFRSLKERPTVWLPVLALILGNAIVTLVYYSSVDFAWFIESSLSNANIPDEAREQAMERMASISPMAAGGSAAVASGLFMLILLLLSATYLFIVSLFTNDGYRFRHWFSLVSWSSFPAVVALLASIVNLLVVGDVAHLPATQLNPLTLANLLALDPTAASAGARLLQFMGLTSIWAIVLVIVGHRTWTGRSILSSTLIVITPLLVIAAVVAVLAR